MQILPIASGKGGVGKSLLSANLAIALGQAGKKVVLADLDIGASNLHLALGHNVKNNSIGTYLTDKSSFQSIIEATEYDNVSFIAGDSQIPGLTTLKAAQKTKLLRNFHSIDADFLILDLGAGVIRFGQQLSLGVSAHHQVSTHVQRLALQLTDGQITAHPEPLAGHPADASPLRSDQVQLP